MLIEIQSDAFKIGNTVRDAISFHSGLNSVVAYTQGNNSVGKTSFLLAIDFAFGGETYYSDEAKIIKNIGHHIINFTFEFNGQKYRYSRSTNEPDLVTACGSNYAEIITQISIEEYKNKLNELYKLEILDMNFRDIISTYIRISHKSPKELSEFLKQHQDEYKGAGVIRFEKLFEKYSLIKEENDKYIHAKNLADAFNKAQKLDFISGSDLKKKEIEDIQKEITELENRNDTICNNSDSEQIANLDKEQATRAAKLQGLLQPLRSKRTKLLNKIETTQKTYDGLLIPTKEELSVLQSFFPNTNIKKLYDIEEFHFKMSDILREELKHSIAQYQLELKNTESQILSLETELQNITPGKTLPKAAYTEYANNFSKIQKLKEKLENFEKGKELKISSDNCKQNLFNKEINILNQISNSVNTCMAELNSSIQEGKWINPMLHFEEPKTNTAKGISNYSLTSNNDSGDGTQGANVILFDLSVLKLSKLPVIIHDGLVRNEIDQEREQDFIKLYAKQNDKQVFTEFNNLNRYSQDIQKILTNSKVIELGNDEKSLYGKSYAIKN